MSDMPRPQSPATPDRPSPLQFLAASRSVQRSRRLHHLPLQLLGGGERAGSEVSGLGVGGGGDGTGGERGMGAGGGPPLWGRRGGCGGVGGWWLLG